MKKNRREQQNQHRADIIDQRGEADIQKAVCFKQRNPVQAEGSPAQHQRDTLRTERLPVEAATQKHQNREQQPAEEGAEQDDLAALEGHVCHEIAVGSEDQHREHIHAVGQKHLRLLCRRGFCSVHGDHPSGPDEVYRLKTGLSNEEASDRPRFYFPSGKLVKKLCSSSGRPARSFSAEMARIRKAMLRPRFRMVWSPSRSFFTSAAEKP